MEKFLLDLLNGIVEINFQLVLNILGIGLIIFWIVVIGWVWSDAGERTTSTSARIGYVLLVTIFNIFGYFVYLIIRPSETIEEIYWADLERRYLKYETAELGDCPKCAAQLYPGYIFCPECGYELKVKCSQCGVYVDKKDKFCAFCSNQINVRKKTEEETPSVEAMEQQIQESKEEAIEVVESDKTRYKTRNSLVKKAGKRVVTVYTSMVDGISKKIVDGVEKVNEIKENGSKKEPKKEDIKQVEKKTSKKKKSKKSKKKKKKSKKK